MDYFISGLGTEANRVASAKITQIMRNDSSDIYRDWVLQRHIFIFD